MTEGSSRHCPMAASRDLLRLLAGERRDRRLDTAVSAARRTWRIRNSYAAMSDNDGHAATTRPVTAGSATAT